MAGLPPFFQQLVPQPGPTLPAPALQDVLMWLAQLQKAAPRTTDMVPAGQGISEDPEIITGRDMSKAAKAATLPIKGTVPNIGGMIDFSAQQGTGGNSSVMDLVRGLLQTLMPSGDNVKDPKTGKTLTEVPLTAMPGGGAAFEGAGEDAIGALRYFIGKGKSWVEGTHPLSDNLIQGENLSKLIKGYFQRLSRNPALKGKLSEVEKDVTDVLQGLQKTIAERYVSSVEKQFQETQAASGAGDPVMKIVINTILKDILSQGKGP